MTDFDVRHPADWVALDADPEGNLTETARGRYIVRTVPGSTQFHFGWNRNLVDPADGRGSE